MIIEGGRRNCAKEMMVLAAALTIQDPRERPPTCAPKPTRCTPASSTTPPTSPPSCCSGTTSTSSRRRCPPRSYAKCATANTSTTCASANGRTSSPSYAKWDVPPTFTPAAAGISTPAHEIDIHKSLLSGLLSHVGVKEEREKDSKGRNRGPREYLGARGTKFVIFPGSGLFKRAPTGCSPPNSSKPPACGRAHQRLHRPAVDRRNRQTPHQRAILRTALVPQLRRGSRLRQGHPLRPDHLRRPPGTVRPRKRRRSPRTVHPVRPRRRPMAHPAQVLPTQPARPRRSRRTRSTPAPPRPARRRLRTLRLLRRTRPRPRHRCARLR